MGFHCLGCGNLNLKIVAGSFQCDVLPTSEIARMQKEGVEVCPHFRPLYTKNRG